MKRFSAFLCILLLSVLPYVSRPAMAAPGGPDNITDEAQKIYQAHGDAIYQVQVIDLASDKKNSIGSAFQFTADGLLATNYHVVAESIQRPTANRLEYLHDKGAKGSLTVLAADIIHDLAILKMDKPGDAFVSLGKSSLNKGARLFSIGNPHDIGFTIIEGTYNGVSEEGFTDKIHFSGSLNPGMSGGPALGHDGKVVGVNVQTAGNQISFLVPVEHLIKLAQKAPGENAPSGTPDLVNTALGDQLLQGQETTLDRLLSKPWESMDFGAFSVPGRIDTAFKCWGAPAHEEKDPFLYFRSTCSSQDRIFIDDGFETGAIFYSYELITAKKGLNLPRFYALYEQEFSRPIEAYYNAKEGDATNFTCQNRFLDLAGGRWKASFCARRYKKYPLIHDMHLYMALVGAGTKGLMISLIAQGISKENAVRLTERFLGEIKPPEKNGKKP